MMLKKLFPVFTPDSQSISSAGFARASSGGGSAPSIGLSDRAGRGQSGVPPSESRYERGLILSRPEFIFARADNHLQAFSRFL
jgi:hypothetical protein